LALLSFFYRGILSVREFMYKKGFKKPKRLPAKVISIGNLTLGGTGKTPAVIAVANEAVKRLYKPCVLTRGYRGREKGPCLSSRDRNHFLKTELVGDEAVLMAYRLNDIPVVKGRNRFLSGVYAIGELGNDAVDLYILDDGFQHWQLHRDMDILLIDATKPFGNGRLFPEGSLREPLDAIGRADVAVITKSDAADGDDLREIEKRIKQFNQDAPVYTAHHEPVLLVHSTGRTSYTGALNNREVYVFSGIANPSYFASLLEKQGADIVKFRSFRDHHFYTQRDMKKIAKEARGLDIITTEKDMVKLKDLDLPDNIYALRVEFKVENGFYDYIFK
jgi:tetraacyldisaccharide 4'-kinase